MKGETKIIGQSSIIKEKLKFIKKARENDKNVLIWGETGVGKEVVARKIHESSPRRDKPFIPVSCANLPENLVESELFGYRKGAFTDAKEDKPGLIEHANGGTIFFDEISELSLYLQAKFLRVIEHKEIRRLGETRTRKMDARFIFATNKDLKKEVKAERFREDLYYRIKVLSFYIPPLRERKEDIPLLVDEVLKRENKKSRKNKRITQQALNKLIEYDYPGNIRELENIVERAHALSDGNKIKKEDIELEKDIEEKDSTNPIVSEILYKRLKQGADYWQTVHEPFKRNELNKDQVWEIICLTLKETPNRKFKEALPRLNIDKKEYKRFLNALKRYNRRREKRKKFLK